MTTLEVRDLVGRGRRAHRRRGLSFTAARRRQDRRRRPQRRRQDQHAEGRWRGRRRRPRARSRAAASARLPAPGPAPAPRRRRVDRPRAHPVRARARGARPPDSRRPGSSSRRTHTEHNIGRFARLEEEYRSLGGYQAESEARTITAGLGLAQDRLALPVGALSGGERRRLELARILFGGSDLLLLDEPTNHLDADAKHWLMRFLASYRGALIVVSHDIGLLDASITRILHLDRDGRRRVPRHVHAVPRVARRRRGAADVARGAAGAGDPPAEDAGRLDARPDGEARAQGEDARHARARSCERAQGDRADARADASAFRFPDPPHCGRPVLAAEDLTKGYGGPPVFNDVSLRRGPRRAAPRSWG